MTNVNIPNGFRPKMYAFGRGEYSGNASKYYWGGGSVVAVGDPVIRVTGATASDPAGVSAAVQVQQTAGSYVTGHVVGFDPVPDALVEVGYMNSGDIGYVYVCDDPDVWLEVQEGGSGTALTTANIGQSINAITFVAGDTIRGTSQLQINNASVTTASTGTYILRQLVQRADVATGQYARWLVQLNLCTEAVSGASSILAI
jgi:hypothetical protein